MAVLLVDLLRISRSLVLHARRQAGIYVNDHVLQAAVTDLHRFDRRVIRRVLLAVRIGGHLNLIVRRRRSFEADLSTDG